MRGRSLLSIIVLLAIVMGGAPWAVEAQAVASWTFFVYLAGDNDLESFALQDFDEMEWVGSTKQVNIVVQFDRAVGYDSSREDWSGARRKHLKRHRKQGDNNSRML